MSNILASLTHSQIKLFHVEQFNWKFQNDLKYLNTKMFHVEHFDKSTSFLCPVFLLLFKLA